MRKENVPWMYVAAYVNFNNIHSMKKDYKRSVDFINLLINSSWRDKFNNGEMIQQSLFLY